MGQQIGNVNVNDNDNESRIPGMIDHSNNIFSPPLTETINRINPPDFDEGLFPVQIGAERRDLFEATREIGRPIRDTNNRYYKIHTKFSLDNILRKINVSYFKFILSFLNSLIHYLNLGSNREYQFKKFNYEDIKVINKRRMSANKSKTIGQLIYDTSISSKYKGDEKNKEKKNHNQKLIEYYSKKSEIMKNIFDGKLLSLFPIYYESKRKVDLSIFGKKDYLILPKTVELFEDLFRESRNSEDDYISKLKSDSKTRFLTE